MLFPYIIFHLFQIPKDFRDNFLKNSENKNDLYVMLIAYLYEASKKVDEITIFITSNSEVLTNQGETSFDDCNHIEADTRVVQFVVASIKLGKTKILVRTGDSDVLIILIGHCKRLLQTQSRLELFCELHTSQSGKKSDVTGYLDVVAIARSFGLNYSTGLPLLHAFSGCDYTPSFYGIGKAKWINCFLNRSDIMELFQRIVENPPDSLTEDDVIAVTSFTLSVYGVDNPEKGLLDGRWQKLNQGVSSFRSLPPSPGAAIMQFRKAIHVASHIWGKAHQPMIEPPDMFCIEQGWKNNLGMVEHIWTITPEPSDSLTYAKLTKTKCGCRKEDNVCMGRCKCRELELPCLYSCKCRRRCQGNGADD